MRTAFWIIVAIVHVAVILRALLLDGRDSYARAAWLLLLIILPGFGTILYLLFGEPWISKDFRQRGRQSYEDLLPYAPRAEGGRRYEGRFANAFRTFEAASKWPVSEGNRAGIAPNSDAAIAMVIADIDAAQHAIHLSFYIWLTDNNGSSVVDAVCRAARRGVICRIVADAVGSHALIRSPAWRAMQAAGAHMCASLAAPFGLGFLVGHRTDLRNHRKIIVIDGRITYCGSQNCADPEFRIKKAFAPWVDIMIRYEGPVARQADLIFASAWAAETGEDLRAYMARGWPASSAGGFPAIAAGTGPLSPRATMTDMFVAVLAEAKERAVITTPYFAPDPPLIAAIIATARRGVDVRIIFPHRNDNRIVGAISRAYYPVLARAGARVFEYRAGLLHAKTLVVDGNLALVGSANMDRRSLDLNFENNILFASQDLAAQVADHQTGWFADSIEIDHDKATKRPIGRRLLDNLLTMAAPLF